MSKNNLRRQAIAQRSQARRLLLQTLYQWQIANDEPQIVFEHRLQDSDGPDIDHDYLHEAFFYISEKFEDLEKTYLPFMNHRNANNLDAVERAILWIGGYEITHRPDIPATVSINEAVELAKQFGANESYTFINATLDKLAQNQ